MKHTLTIGSGNKWSTFGKRSHSIRHGDEFSKASDGKQAYESKVLSKGRRVDTLGQTSCRLRIGGRMALVERPTDLFRSKEVDKRPIQLYLEKSKKIDVSYIGSNQSQYSMEKHVG